MKLSLTTNPDCRISKTTVAAATTTHKTKTFPFCDTRIRQRSTAILKKAVGVFTIFFKSKDKIGIRAACR